MAFDSNFEMSDLSTEAKANMRERVKRRELLLQHIIRNGKDIEKDHLLGVFMIRAGVSQSTTYQYLSELKMARLVIEHNGQIMCSEDYKKMLDENAKHAKKLGGK